MWKYIKKYLPFMLLAALCMVGEVSADLLQPSLMTKVVDDGVLGVNNGGTGSMDIILSYGLKMLGVMVLGGLFGVLCGVFANIACNNIGNSLRKESFRSVMGFSFEQVDKMSTGAIITRITNDITQVESMLMQIVRGAIRTSFLFIGSIIFMVRLYPQYGIIVLCSMPFLLLCIFICLKKASKKYPQIQSQIDGINSIMQEDITGIRIIKACVRELHEKARFGEANRKLTDTQLSVLIIFAVMSPVMNAIMYIVVVAILYFGSFGINGSPASPGTIMGAITYTSQLLNGFMGMVMIFQNISRGMTSWNRVNEILSSEPAISDGNMREETAEKGSVEFKNVSFSYPGDSEKLLHDINLRINPGETVGIMGETGSGKSTLIRLIARFYDCDEGEVLVDGVNVKEYPLETLRNKLSMALQTAELFSIPVKDNISWGKPGASIEEITEAAKIAQADGFISEMPEGYDTLVAERGMSMSGGQKQRVSLARAVLKNAEIFIFDDATSALDLKTEAEFYRALADSRGNVTKIIIAQRIASVKNADKIVVLDDGGISAVGSHDELMASSEIYKDIYNSQMGGDEDGE